MIISYLFSKPGDYQINQTSIILGASLGRRWILGKHFDIGFRPGWGFSPLFRRVRKRIEDAEQSRFNLTYWFFFLTSYSLLNLNLCYGDLMKTFHIFLLLSLQLVGCSDPISTATTDTKEYPTSAPTVPADFQYTILDSLIQLTWDDSTTLNTYNISMSISRGENITDTLFHNVRSPFTIKRSDSSSTYTFRIKAKNALGESNFSEELTCKYYAEIVNTDPYFLSLITDKPELAPGDTVTLRTSWSQNPVIVSDIEWRVSWKLKRNSYGLNSVEDTLPLGQYMVQPMTLTHNHGDTSEYQMSIIIPEDIVVESPNTQKLLKTALAEYGWDITPSDYDLPDSCKHVAAYLDSIASLDIEAKKAIPEEQGNMLNTLCKLLTVEFRIFWRFKKSRQFHYGDLTVRYNSRLAPIAGIEIEQ